MTYRFQRFIARVAFKMARFPRSTPHWMLVLRDLAPAGNRKFYR